MKVIGRYKARVQGKGLAELLLGLARTTGLESLTKAFFVSNNPQMKPS